MKLIHLKEDIELTADDIEEYQYLINKIAHVKKQLLDVNNNLVMKAVRIFGERHNSSQEYLRGMVEMFFTGWDGGFPVLDHSQLHLYYSTASPPEAFERTPDNFYDQVCQIVFKELHGFEIQIGAFSVYDTPPSDNLWLQHIETKPASYKQYLVITNEHNHLYKQYNKLFDEIVDFFKRHQL